MKTNKELERRLIDVYRRYVKGAHESGRGSKVWIADVADLHPTSVHRMLSGGLPPDRLRAALDMIEMGPSGARQDAAEVFWSDEDGAYVARWLTPSQWRALSGVGDTPSAAVRQLATATSAVLDGGDGD